MGKMLKELEEEDLDKVFEGEYDSVDEKYRLLWQFLYLRAYRKIVKQFNQSAVESIIKSDNKAEKMCNVIKTSDEAVTICAIKLHLKDWKADLNEPQRPKKCGRQKGKKTLVDMADEYCDLYEKIEEFRKSEEGGTFYSNMVDLLTESVKKNGIMEFNNALEEEEPPVRAVRKRTIPADKWDG